MDGHEYVDLLNDYSACLFGHDPEPVASAVRSALQAGWSYGGVHADEREFASHIVARFDGVDQARFTNSGTEANLMAISLARRFTGREHVIVFDGAYHGSVLSFSAAGESMLAPFPFVRCSYNDLESVAEVFTMFSGRIAAVLVEPMMGAGGCIRASDGFIAGLRRLCDATGSLLVFDEIMTSRMAWGGAQARLGVLADITTLGKYIAGGMSIGAFGGRAEVMSAFDSTKPAFSQHSGTFNNNRISMSAGVAVARHLISPGLLDELFETGEHLRRKLGVALAAEQLPLGITGWGSLMNIHPTRRTVESPMDLTGGDRRWNQLLLFDLLERGFSISPRGFITLSTEITQSICDDFVGAIEACVENLAGEFADGL